MAKVDINADILSWKLILNFFGKLTYRLMSRANFKFYCRMLMKISFKAVHNISFFYFIYVNEPSLLRRYMRTS